MGNNTHSKNTNVCVQVKKINLSLYYKLYKIQLRTNSRYYFNLKINV